MRAFRQSFRQSETLGHSRDASSSARKIWQTTLARAIHCQGKGLHSGRPVRLVLSPAPAESGLRFQRLDLPNRPIFRLTPRHIVSTLLSTIAGCDIVSECRIATIEHLLSALHALSIDNVLIQTDAAELPILDGCAEAFSFLIQCAGVTTLCAPRLKIEILRAVQVRNGDASATLSPLPANAAPGLYLSLTIAFPQPIIGRQSWGMRLTEEGFLKHIARSRTFVAHEEVSALQARGLALGGSLDNALVIDKDRVLNPGGTRGTDEFVRHKILDAIGDLYCAGHQLIGSFEGALSGHALNNKLLRTLFATPANWRFVTEGPSSSTKRGIAPLSLPHLHDIRHLWSAAS